MSDARKLDLNLLAVLVALHDEGGVSRAAGRLKTSQPSVSAALARLRDYFGDPLFVRRPGGMSPTPRGAEVAATARDILVQVRERLQPDARYDPAVAGRAFTFALSDVGEIVFLPRLLQVFSSEASTTPVCSVSMRPAQLIEAMTDDEVDLAIGYFPDLKGHDFFSQRLLTHQFACLLRADHPVRGSRLTMGEFLSLPHAVVHSEGRSQEIFESFLAAHGLARRVQLYTPHFLSIPKLIANSDMLVTVPHALAIEYGNAVHGLRSIRLPFGSPRIALHQYWHRRVQLDARSRWLRCIVAGLFHEGSDQWPEIDSAVNEEQLALHTGDPRP